MPIVFQYGSNCDAQRLNAPSRLGGAARDLGRAKTVASFRITFNKWSERNRCAAADLIRDRNKGSKVWGVLYQLSAEAFDRLARVVEGPGYKASRIAVTLPSGARKNVTTFMVRPEERRKRLATSAEYVGHIVRGLRDHGAPEKYVQQVIAIAIKTNRSAAPSADAEPIERIESFRSRSKS